ncbi:MAG: MarR family transcriptional regulator [Planctomycetes bacterium]|nr:MarR family transcriptional regulator [Planctomycetota bacterium]
MGKLQQDLKKRGPFESVQQEVVISILRTNGQFQYQFAQLFKEFELTGPQYNILRILRGEGAPLPSLEIASRMITVAPALTSLIDKLEKRALVQRKRCTKDRRVWYVELTSKGKKLVEKMDQPNLEMHSRLVGHLSKKECSQLLLLLEKAREGMPIEDGKCLSAV